MQSQAKHLWTSAKDHATMALYVLNIDTKRKKPLLRQTLINLFYWVDKDFITAVRDAVVKKRKELESSDIPAKIEMPTELANMLEKYPLKSKWKSGKFMRNSTYLEMADKRKANMVDVQREYTEMMDLKKQNVGDVKSTVRNIISKQTNITNMNDQV